MARIEWVKHRLENWALWHERSSSGGLGYASQAIFMSVQTSAPNREAIIPVEELDAALTDQAVSSLKPGRPQLHDTLHLIYLAGIGIKAAARTCGCAESTIKARLEQADHALAQWFQDRSAAAAQRSFTS
jgi:DNA-directed RNA polymerase specialized sigma24 family protein